jgi:hypothetical protein
MRSSRIFTIFFIALILLSIKNEKAFGACPDGYSSTSKTITIYNCPMQVDICYKCYGVSIEYIVNIVGFGFVDDNCIPSQGCNIVQKVYEAIVNPEYLNEELCPNNIPPCTTGTVQVKVKYFSCWYKYWDSYQGHVMWEACEDKAYCEVVYEYCWDPILEIWQVNVKSHTGNNWPPTCTLNIPPDPDENDPPTDCFNGAYSPCE